MPTCAAHRARGARNACGEASNSRCRRESARTRELRPDAHTPTARGPRQNPFTETRVTGSTPPPVASGTGQRMRSWRTSTEAVRKPRACEGNAASRRAAWLIGISPRNYKATLRRTAVTVISQPQCSPRSAPASSRSSRLDPSAERGSSDGLYPRRPYHSREAHSPEPYREPCAAYMRQVRAGPRNLQERDARG